MSIALDDPRREAFAQAMGRGLSARAAAREAGYVFDRPCLLKVLAERPEVKARTEHWVRVHACGGDELLAEAYAELMRLAAEAGKKTTVAALRESRALLAEAVRLRLAARRTAPEAEPRAPMPPDLTREQWKEKHAPKR